MTTHVSKGPFVTVPGIFHNAEQAADIPVLVHVEGNDLVIADETGAVLARWPLKDLRLAGHAPVHGLRIACGKRDLARLIIKDEAFIAALRKRAPQLVEERIFDMHRLRLVAALILVLIVTVFAVFFVAVPISATQLARIVPEEWRRQMGEAVKTALIEDFAHRAGRPPEDLICTGEVGTRVLDAMMARLTPQIQSDLPVRVTVLDYDLVNAFAVPGGQIIVFRGLLNFARNGDEVASVIAHELGHVEARDPSRTVFETGSTPVLLKLMFGDFGGRDLALSVGQLILSAKNSRDKETAADTVALRALAGAGVDPEALAGFLDRFHRSAGAAPPEFRWMLSHPDALDRAASVRARIDRTRSYEPIISQNDFLRLRFVCADREKRFDQRLPVKNRKH